MSSTSLFNVISTEGNASAVLASQISALNSTGQANCSYLINYPLDSNGDHQPLLESHYDPDYVQLNMKLIQWSVLDIQGTRRIVLEVTIATSTLLLAISLLVYVCLRELRTVPGKCLMGLIVSDLSVKVYLLVYLRLHKPPGQTLCIVTAILGHYLILTVVLWTGVIGEFTTIE